MSLLDLITTAGSVAGGGVFGMLGSLAGGWFKRDKAKTDHKHELELLGLNAANQRELNEDQMLAARAAMSADGLSASIRADGQIQSSGWAADIKTLYRPFLTTMLLFTSTVIFYELMGALDGDANALAQAFSKQELVDMLRYTVYTLVFSTATAITWWFGDRAFSPPGMK